MRIEHLMFERYGLFTDRKLSFHPEAALHVVLGANEAGKTSALSGIGDLLFGFGGRTDYDFRHDSKLLRIGGAFRHSDGRTIAARRRKGNKNTLVDHADQPLPDDTLAALLDGLTRDAFNREFGLTAGALRAGGQDLLSAGGRLAETLAASSAGMTALSRLKDRLQNEADELFTPRRSGSRQFYLAADRRDVADKTLRDAVVTREALQQLQADVADAQAKRDALNAAHASCVGTLARWQRTLRVRSHLARIDTIGADVATLAHLPDVSAQALAAWDAAHDTDMTLARELAALDDAAALDAADIAALAVDDGLLAAGIAIDPLGGRLFVIQKDLEDLPRRRQAHEAAEATLNDAARRLGLASHVDVLAKLPTDPALALARDLIDKIKSAEQAIAEAAARHGRARQERDAIAADQGEAPAVVDVAQLRQRFDALGDVPAQADRLRRDTATLALETDALKAAVASLDPSPGALEALRALPLPERVTISKFANASEIGDAEVKRLGDAIAAWDAAIAATETELARLSSAGAVPTRGDLAAARLARDTHLDDLRAALDGDRGQRAMRFAEVAKSSLAIDGITDRLLTDTERAALFDDAQRRLADSRAARDGDAAKLAKCQAELGKLDARWLREWAASGLAPRSPGDMLRWRERLDEVLMRFGKRDAQQAEIETLSAGLESGTTALIAFLSGVGRVADKNMPVEVLYREAKARIEALQAAWADAKARVVATTRIERDLNEAEAARATGEAKLAALRQAWPAAMDGIGRPADSTPVEAEAALAVWRDVPVPKASHEREGRSVTTMEHDLQAFDRDVFAVVDRAAPELKTESAQESLALLSTKLAEARRASEAVRRLQDGVAKRAVHRHGLMARRAAIAATLDEARRRIGLPGDAALAEPLAQLSRRHQLADDLASRRRDLHEIGDGRDEDALRQEREGLDLDLLPGEIARETLQQDQLLKDIADASAVRHQKATELDHLTKGRDAASAATERAEASAELLLVAERWLLRSAAAKLAARAIERHRAMVQDPLIAQASVLFAMATGGAFAGLGIDYGDDDQPVLIARRGEGERVQVAGLSEGTRDQLFLALRLALLERRTSEPMPFIGDDLLASFDETRTLATLRLLAAAGRRRQVILFTHHRHVADLARSVQGEIVDVIEL